MCMARKNAEWCLNYGGISNYTFYGLACYEQARLYVECVTNCLLLWLQVRNCLDELCEVLLLLLKIVDG